MVAFFKKLNKKTAVIIALCLVLVFSAATGVLAYLVSKPDPLPNSFVPARVTCAVEEQVSAGVYRNATVRNTGNVDAYIRAAVIATFQSADGKVLATAPVEGTDYTVTWGGNGWQKGSDGYWYYANAVNPDGLTSNLIEVATQAAAPDGYELKLQIVATAIQSDPERAVEDAWGITPTNGKLIPN